MFFCFVLNLYFCIKCDVKEKEKKRNKNSESVSVSLCFVLFICIYFFNGKIAKYIKEEFNILIGSRLRIINLYVSDIFNFR